MNKPKFRAWHKRLSLMCEVISIDFENNKIIVHHKLSGKSVPLDFADVILMQYTGLKDKNGVDIYEGDVLVYDAPKKYAHRRSMHEIAYADGRFFWQFLDLIFCQSNILYRDGYLVIGNIHENPELLSGVE